MWLCLLKKVCVVQFQIDFELVMSRKKICFVVAVPGTAQSFLKDHIKALAEKYDIYLAANFPDDYEVSLPGLKDVKHIAIQRNISPIADLKAVNKLTSYFKEQKFDAVHSVTPKAGLITALAAKMAGVKHRIHIFTGQVWASRKGGARMILKSIDKLIVALNNHILVDGEAQRKFLISEGVLTDKNSKVLGAGSICGVNTVKFTPLPQEREREREDLCITPEKVVYCFMGRLNRDKGIYELLQAFNDMAPECPNAYLLIFGSDEEKCMSHINEYPNIREGVNFQYPGSTSTPHLSLQAADVFCLPSYREGFGMSVIEASCLGLPIICSDAYGLGDTIEDNTSGIRCKVGDVKSLFEAMKYMYFHPVERKEMGENGRNRVLDLFPCEKIVGAWVDYYKALLK